MSWGCERQVWLGIALLRQWLQVRCLLYFRRIMCWDERNESDVTNDYNAKTDIWATNHKANQSTNLFSLCISVLIVSSPSCLTWCVYNYILFLYDCQMGTKTSRAWIGKLKTALIHVLFFECWFINTVLQDIQHCMHTLKNVWSWRCKRCTDFLYILCY